MIKGCIFVFFMIVAVCSGWTYVPVSDDNLVKHSHTVIIGTVIEELSQDTFNLNGTYRFHKVRVTKLLSANKELSEEVIIRTLGGPEPSSDTYLHVPGSPSFSQGETVLLFIQPSDRFYVIDHFALGAFHQIDYDDGKSKSSYAYRTSDHDSPSSQIRLRDFNKFSDWIQSGHRRRDTSSQSYWNDISENVWSNLQRHISPVRSRYSQLKANGVPVRWSQFDSGSTITWMSDPAGQPGLNGGGFAEISQGFSAWGSVPGASIKYAFGGTTTSSLGGLSTSDGKQGILWDTTARNEIPGSFNCATGGVIAIGGWRTQSQPMTFRGITFYKITEGDTTIQDGLACWLSRSSTPSKDFANAITHEFGHTLGLDHSCGDTESGTCTAGSDADKAIMRAYTHNGVGPVLGTDDVLGAQYIYASCFPNCESTQPSPTPSTPPSPSPTPNTPSGLTVSSTAFVIRFDVDLASFNKRQVNLGFCELLNVDSSDCSDEYFANTNIWAGSTYYQFSLAGPLIAYETTLQDLVTNSPSKVSSAVGYTILSDNSEVSDSDSDSKILGLKKMTAIYVFIGGGIGVVLLISLCVMSTVLARRKSDSNRYRRSSSVTEAPPTAPEFSENFSPEVRPPIYAMSNMRQYTAPVQSLGIGSYCNARWSGDDQYYEARIIHQSGDHFLVSFVDFDDSNKDEWVLKTKVRA